MKPKKILKYARMNAGLTQEDIATMLGVSVMSVYRWERGVCSPGWYVRKRLCNLLQISEKELGFQDEEGNSSSKASSSFLIDPSFPVHQMDSMLGQQALLQEIVSSPCRTLGIVGLPGSGKSSVAQAIASMPDLAKEVEGILWASLGQADHPHHHLQRWLLLLGDGILPEKEEETHQRLRALLRERKMLILLDDLWKAEDILPYQCLGAQCRYVITTRLPIVANTVCDRILHPRTLTAMQAFHLVSSALPLALVREHSAALRALCQQVGHLPLAVEQIGLSLRREARTLSSRRFQEALTTLVQPASYLHLHLPPHGCSLAASLQRSEAWLSPAKKQAFVTLASLLPSAPATFDERQVNELLHSHPFQLSDFDQLVDVGLLDIVAKNRYQIHPVIADYARLRATEEPPFQMLA